VASPEPGLCASCARQQVVRTGRGSVFSLCLRHKTEPERFAKYPRLPILRCAGYEPPAGAASSSVRGPS
jgi:hypothetical protein